MSPSPLPNFSKLAITPTMEAPSHGIARAPTAEEKGKGQAPTQDDTDDSSDPGDSDEDPEDASDSSDDGRLFALDHCRQIDRNTDGPMYAFQIAYAEVENYSIRFEPGTPIHCSCREDRCRHENWLLQQLSRIPTEQAVGPANIKPYTLISTRGLINVCENLDWEFRESPNDEETKWQLTKLRSILEDPVTEFQRLEAQRIEAHRQTRTRMRERSEIVRSIMATLSPNMGRDDYRDENFQNLPNFQTINMENIFVPRDLEATVFRLLLFDDRIFNLFESLATPNARTLDYFSKLEMKARDACRLLDEYCRSGPGADLRHYNVQWCAQELTNIVRAILDNITATQPLSLASRESAAQALVSILEMVVDRNQEAYQLRADITWDRPRPLHERLIDRNLYQRLIGERNNNSANPPGQNFVLDALENLPGVARIVGQLEDILHNRLDHVAWSRPDSPYNTKLRAIIARLKGSPDLGTPRSSSTKRSAASGSSGRNVKRMK